MVNTKKADQNEKLMENRERGDGTPPYAGRLSEK
jgi:hypothetical protein